MKECSQDGKQINQQYFISHCSTRTWQVVDMKCYSPEFGPKIRLCNSKNPNDVEFIFDHEDCAWEDSFGSTICEPLSNHHTKEIVEVFAMISKHPYHPTIELFDSESEATNAAKQEISHMEDETGWIDDAYVAVAKILWKKNIRTNC